MKALPYASNVVVLGAAMCVSAGAQAEITLYTDRAAFVAAVPGTVTDNLDDLAPGWLEGEATRKTASVSYRISAGPSDAGLYLAGPAGAVAVTATMASDALTFDQFTPGMRGFGGLFYGSDAYGEYSVGRALELTAIADGKTLTFTLAPDSSQSFFGLVSSTDLESVSLRNLDEDGNVYWATADSLVLAVPEPATWAMLLGGIGLMGVGTSRRRRALFSRLVAGIGIATVASAAYADGPGRGQTATFEKNYLTFIIDHHYSALRMSELAAGTDTTRDAQVVDPEEGTSPSPGFAATSGKASDVQIKSMARLANRMQREEIGRAQRWLRDWYGVQHEPQLNDEGRRMIAMLDGTPEGTQFDQVFLRMFSNHHLSALAPSLHCVVKSDIGHGDLQRYCEDIVMTQKNSINDMRNMLCKQFSQCDFVPLTGDKRKDNEF